MNCTLEHPDAMKMDCSAANSQQSDNKCGPLASSGAHPAPPAADPPCPSDEGESDQGNDNDSRDSPSALLEALDAARIQLAALRAENYELRDRAVALEALDAHVAYLSSLLALCTFQRCAAVPLLPDVNAVEATAERIFDIAFEGRQPEVQMYDSLVRLPPSIYIRIDNAFKYRFLQHLVQWRAEPSADVRATMRQIALNVIQARERGRHRLALAFPDALLHIFREGVPNGPAHVAARREKQAHALDSIVLKHKQLNRIREAWQEYLAGVEAIDQEAAVEARLAEIGAMGEPQERGSLWIRQRLAEGMASSVARVRRATARRVVLYSCLVHRVMQALTWTQAAHLIVSTAPYLPEYTEVCREVLQRAEEACAETAPLASSN